MKNANTSGLSAQHLISALNDKYEITVGKTGENFCGLKLKWNYSHNYADIAMPGFVKKTLSKLNCECINNHQLAPHKWQTPIHGKNWQFFTSEDTLNVLNKVGIKYVQKTVGLFLYYARAVDNTILPVLNEIALYQTKPTKKYCWKMQILLDYLHSI